MTFKAVVKHGGGLAHYILTTENEGIYLATLMRFDGRPDKTPPRSIILIRGASQWTAGHSEVPQELLNELGPVIDAKLRQVHGVHSRSNEPSAEGSRHT